MLEGQREARLQGWLNGQYVASFSAEYIAKDSLAKGYCNAINEILNLEAEDLVNE